ncbi:MAG: helix-turn-helix domain-containing protein, partial [Roseiflexaceae bacterium]
AQQMPGAGPRLLLVESDASLLPEPLAAAVPIHLRVPPLRARTGDVPLLASAFAGERTITSPAMQHLDSYAWPDNIAELRSIIVSAAQLSGADPIDTMHLPKQLQDVTEYPTQGSIMLPLEGINLEDVEQNLIRQALERTHGNKSKAAELLGLSRHTLLYRMEKYGITAPERS